jgi:hypothetical protein
MMRLLDALRQAGRNGVIARQAHTDVIIVRSLNQSTGRAVLVQVADEQIGNWTPTDEDFMATDWLVIAKSIWSHQ